MIDLHVSIPVSCIQPHSLPTTLLFSFLSPCPSLSPSPLTISPIYIRLPNVISASLSFFFRTSICRALLLLAFRHPSPAVFTSFTGCVHIRHRLCSHPSPAVFTSFTGCVHIRHRLCSHPSPAVFTSFTGCVHILHRLCSHPSPAVFTSQHPLLSP